METDAAERADDGRAAKRVESVVSPRTSAKMPRNGRKIWRKRRCCRMLTSVTETSTLGSRCRHRPGGEYSVGCVSESEGWAPGEERLVQVALGLDDGESIRMLSSAKNLTF